MVKWIIIPRFERGGPGSTPGRGTCPEKGSDPLVLGGLTPFPDNTVPSFSGRIAP